MTERLQLTIQYKNGNELKRLVNYIHYESDAIWFTEDVQAHSVFQIPVRVSLANVESFQANTVTCEGWNVVE